MLCWASGATVLALRESGTACALAGLSLTRRFRGPGALNAHHDFRIRLGGVCSFSESLAGSGPRQGAQATAAGAAAAIANYSNEFRLNNRDAGSVRPGPGSGRADLTRKNSASGRPAELEYSTVTTVTAQCHWQ